MGNTSVCGAEPAAGTGTNPEDQDSQMIQIIRNATMTFLVAAAALGASGVAAESEMRCSQHGKIIGQFANVYKEIPVAGGLTEDGRLVEVLSTGDGKTWTIIISKPNGETCVMMAGEGWQKLKFKPAAEEPKA